MAGLSVRQTASPAIWDDKPVYFAADCHSNYDYQSSFSIFMRLACARPSTQSRCANGGCSLVSSGWALVQCRHALICAYPLFPGASTLRTGPLRACRHAIHHHAAISGILPGLLYDSTLRCGSLALTFDAAEGWERCRKPAIAARRQSIRTARRRPCDALAPKEADRA